MKKEEYEVDLAYPSLDLIVENENDLSMIIEDYSGIISEFSAISQYFYHHLYADKEFYKDIGLSLMRISMVEMKHLGILGEVILKLGGDPKLIKNLDDNSTNYWTGDIIDYSKEIKAIILSDMKLEELTINNYKKHSKASSQKALSDVLDRLILDEVLHLKILYKLLMSLNDKKGDVNE